MKCLVLLSILSYIGCGETKLIVKSKKPVYGGCEFTLSGISEETIITMCDNWEVGDEL